MFVVIIVSLVLLAHCYLWVRLVRHTTGPGRLRKALTGVLATLLVVLVATFVGTRMGLESWLAWPGYIWLAVMFYLVLLLLVLELPRAVVSALLRANERRASGRAPDPEPVAVPAGAAAAPGAPQAAAPAPAGASPVEAPPPADAAVSRRLFLGRATAAIAGVSALGTVGYGMTSALGDPLIERVKVALPKLDPRLNGLRFAVVSDIHLGPLTGVGHTERIVRMINGLEADVVAIVGDLVDGTVARLGHLARPLKSLESRYGAYFVTGNHEYFTAEGPEEWIEELGQLGVRSLRNERVEIRHQGAVLDLAGVNDVGGAARGDGPDFGKALGGREAGRSAVLLAHQPVQAREAARHGVDLQLSGHTHGGQMAPFNLVVGLQQPVVSGLATVDGTQVYVSRGAGFWGPPVRVGAPPEISLVELRS
ncbi:metallophosphoesterase [Nonomuraea candida]|uniref:metallophosphoesterase n=1 Tax=Nonomuraea candida TaxID=359159 RepID=UPI0005B7D737|nr:metallophosphoesterase [Nonomuraea candida]